MSTAPIFAVPVAESPMYAAGFAGISPVQEYLHAVRAKEIKPIHFLGRPFESQGVLSVVAIGSQVASWNFECGLSVSERTIKASAHGRDIELSLEIAYSLELNQPKFGDWDFEFRVVPNPVVDSALWFHQLFRAIVSERCSIRIGLESKDAQFLLHLQFPPEKRVDPSIIEEVDQRIEFYQELIAIGAVFNVSFRIPEFIELKDLVVAHRVARAIERGVWADCDIFTYPPVPLQVFDPPDPGFFGREVDVRLTERNTTVQLLGHELHLGPQVFIAPSALVSPVGRSTIKIDYRKFGGYSFFLNYSKEAMMGAAAQDVSAKDWLANLQISEPSLLSQFEKQPFWSGILREAKAEQERRESWLEARPSHGAGTKADETGRPRAKRSTYERACAFVASKENAAQYAGKWIALDGDIVVAVGERPADVSAEAHRKGVVDPVLHYFLAPAGQRMDWGGWQ